MSMAAHDASPRDPKRSEPCQRSPFVRTVWRKKVIHVDLGYSGRPFYGRDSSGPSPRDPKRSEPCQCSPCKEYKSRQ